MTTALDRWTRVALLLAGAAVSAVGIPAAVAGCSVQPGVNGMTREQGDAILAELQEVRRLLIEQRAHPAEGETPANGRVQLEDVAVYSLGSSTAPVTLVEFTDYQCPFCKRFHDVTWPELKSKYIDTGKVRYVVRDLPLDFHPEAMPASVAVRCAGDQGKFWPVHDALFAAQETLSASVVRRVVLGQGVAAAGYDKCAANAGVRQAIEADAAAAQGIGINGTPGFVLARRSGGKLEGTTLLGAQPFAVFAARIDALLATQTAQQ